MCMCCMCLSNALCSEFSRSSFWWSYTNVDQSYSAVSIVMTMSGGQRRWKEERYLTAPWQHSQDTLPLPRETLNPAFNSFGICTCVCLCEGKCIDGWGCCTDIPNPCKLSELMESVQLQAKIFVTEREDCACMSVCACVCGRERACFYATMCECAWSMIWKDQDPSLLMITQTLKMVFNIQSTHGPLSVDKSSSNLIYIPITDWIPPTNHTQITMPH